MGSQGVCYMQNIEVMLKILRICELVNKASKINSCAEIHRHFKLPYRFLFCLMTTNFWSVRWFPFPCLVALYKIFFLSNLYIFLFILLGSFLGEGILFCLNSEDLVPPFLDGSYTAFIKAQIKVFLRGLFLAWTVITCNCCPNDPNRKLYERWLSFLGVPSLIPALSSAWLE